MVPEWQTRRSKFNHDWLKIEYINRLDACIQRLCISDDSTRVQRFLDNDFSVWEAKRVDVQYLINNFEAEMSPKVLIEQLPLRKLGPKQCHYIKMIVHEMWLCRFKVKEQVELLRKAFFDADDRYKQLADVISKCDAPKNSFYKKHLPYFQSFLVACRKLGNVIHTFPHKIHLT
jgi:hypothetical protein